MATRRNAAKSTASQPKKGTVAKRKRPNSPPSYSGRDHLAHAVIEDNSTKISQSVELTTKDPTEHGALPSNTARKSQPIFAWILEILALFFWIYIVAKALVFDFDTELLRKFAPSMSWIVNYRFLVILGILSAALIVLERKSFLRKFVFVFMYPVIVVLWRIPKFVIVTAFNKKNWLVPFAILNALVMFFRSLRYHILTRSFWVIAFVLILTVSFKPVLIASMTVLFLVICISYLFRFKAVFSASPLFKSFKKITQFASSSIKNDPKAENETTELSREERTNKQLEERRNRLESSILFNRIALFAALRLREYQKSGISLAAGIVTTLGAVVGTILTFSAIHYALYKIDPAQFRCNSVPSFFSFFFYSFNTLGCILINV